MSKKQTTKSLPKIDPAETTSSESEPESRAETNDRTADASAASDGVAPDFEQIRVEEPAASGESIFEGDFEEVGASDPTPESCYTVEEFFDAFQKAHAMLGMFTGLRSLPISDFDREQAREASNAIWETAAEDDSPFRFVIRKGNRWFGRVGAILTYGVIKGQLVRAELSALRPSTNQAATDTSSSENPTGETEAA